MSTWYAIYIDHNSTLKELRKIVAEKTNIEVERFSLYLISGNILLLNNDDEKQLYELGIVNETTFTIIIRLS